MSHQNSFDAIEALGQTFLKSSKALVRSYLGGTQIDLGIGEIRLSIKQSRHRLLHQGDRILFSVRSFFVHWLFSSSQINGSAINSRGISSVLNRSAIDFINRMRDSRAAFSCAHAFALVMICFRRALVIV